jgi:hypothetical protein
MKTDLELAGLVDGAKPWLPDVKPNGHAGAAQPRVKWFRFPWEFEPAKPPRLVKGLIAAGDEVLVYGPPEAGKTFFLIDLACRWACSEPWRGRDVEQGLVVYLAGERKLSVQNRIRAWATRNGKQLEAVPILVLDRPLNLLRPDDDERDAVAAEIQAAAAKLQMPVVAIISDTIHSLSPGSKEDAYSFGLLLDQVRRLRDAIGQVCPIALLYCHHTGKDEDRGPRGGNALPAGMSLSISIGVRLEKYRLVEVDKNSDLAERPHIEPFVIESVIVDRTTDHEPIRIGVHVAIPITEVPSPPEEELRAMAAKLSREGMSQRAIAKAVSRSASTVNDWLQPSQDGSAKRRRRARP